MRDKDNIAPIVAGCFRPAQTEISSQSLCRLFLILCAGHIETYSPIFNLKSVS